MHYFRLGVGRVNCNRYLYCMNRVHQISITISIDFIKIECFSFNPFSRSRTLEFVWSDSLKVSKEIHNAAIEINGEEFEATKASGHRIQSTQIYLFFNESSYFWFTICAIVHCEQFRIVFLCSAATEANYCNIFAILLQLHCCHKTTYILAQVGRCNAFKFYSSITSQLFAQFKLAFGSSILENRSISLKKNSTCF